MRIRGGERLHHVVDDQSRALGTARAVAIGFLENATYPDGKQVAMIAAIQEYGTGTIPPRPFFRNMIAAKSPEWPSAIKNLLLQNNYDAARTLEQAGQAVAGQLRQSIVDTNDPPLAPSTIRRKGSTKPLVQTGHMLNSVDHEVIT